DDASNNKLKTVDQVKSVEQKQSKKKRVVPSRFEMLEVKPNVNIKKQQCQSKPTKMSEDNKSSVASRFADIDSDDDEIESITEIYPKPPKIVKLDHPYAMLNTENENHNDDDGEEDEKDDDEINNDHNKSVHLEVMQKMLQELKQEDEAEKPLAMDCQKMKSKSSVTTMHIIDHFNIYLLFPGNQY
ncbi:hypothetical protein BLA29_010346, partial [Euroglyphus maynei]